MSDSPSLSLGAALSGRWQVTEFLGRGETGEVYAVRDLHGSGVFALKLLHGSPRPELLSSFQQAARTASALNVEGIARASDFGIDANSGRAFFVAERVNWESLDRMLRTHGPLSVAQLGVALEVIAKALEAAHTAGVVHRDLKPQNVFISADNPAWVRITDFGVSILRNAAPPAPGWGGTPGWVGVDGADPAAPPTRAMDVFALGLVCFFALTRHSPYRSMLAVPVDTTRLWDEMNQRVLSWAARANECGVTFEPALDTWFSKALALSPADRFQSVAEMLATFPGRTPATLDGTTAPPDFAAMPHAAAPAIAGYAQAPVAAASPNPYPVSPTVPDQQPQTAIPYQQPPTPAYDAAVPAAYVPHQAALPAPPPSMDFPASAPEKPRKKSLLPLAIGGAILLFVGAAAAGWAILGRKSTVAEPPLPAAKPATSAAPQAAIPPAPAASAAPEPPSSAAAPVETPPATSVPTPEPSAAPPPVAAVKKPSTTKSSKTATTKPTTTATASAKTAAATTAPPTTKPATTGTAPSTTKPPVRSVAGAVKLGSRALGAATAAKPAGTNR